jgi:hypothetical protein
MYTMDPAKVSRLAEMAKAGITPAERGQADELLIAAMVASGDYKDRQAEVWGVLITRQRPSPPTWEQLFDDLTPDRAVRLGELYDALPDGAHTEYDKRYWRPRDV